MNYEKMKQLKNATIRLLEEEIFFNYDIIYNLIGLILIPYQISIIIKLNGNFIKKEFKNYNNYLHDNLKNEGRIIEFNNGDDIFQYGIPHIIIYKKN